MVTANQRFSFFVVLKQSHRHISEQQCHLLDGALWITSYLFVDPCGFVERKSQKCERVIGDPQMLSHDSQFYKWLLFFLSEVEFSVLQMENDIFTNTHIFVKTNTQVTNRKFVFVESKTRVQLKAYL